MSATEKLTIQALIDHDKVYPKFKASRGPGTQASSGRDKKEEGELTATRRPRLTSTTESQKSSGHAKTGSGINFFRLVAATRAWQRLAKRKAASHSTAATKPVVKMENTYKTEPDPEKKFLEKKVENVIKDTLELKLKDQRYDPLKCRNFTKDLSNLIKQRVKQLDCPRYKLVCHVVIMESGNQSAEVASRCLWNDATDRFASYTFKNESLVATAFVYGVYFE